MVTPKFHSLILFPLITPDSLSTCLLNNPVSNLICSKLNFYSPYPFFSQSASLQLIRICFFSCSGQTLWSCPWFFPFFCIPCPHWVNSRIYQKSYHFSPSHQLPPYSRPCISSWLVRCSSFLVGISISLLASVVFCLHSPRGIIKKYKSDHSTCLYSKPTTCFLSHWE